MEINDDLIQFLNNSPTAWHAVKNVKAKLIKQGFQELHESESWHLQQNGRYFTVRNGSTLCAFIIPNGKVKKACILGAHTDSPALKLKPNAEFRKKNMIMWGVEIYGGPLINSWLNRDLGIAGRICYSSKNKTIQETLIQIEDHPVTIPQLAIHLDRNVNENGLQLNKQDQLAALAATTDESSTESSYLEMLLKKHISFDDLLGHDLFLYPLEPARYMGNNRQMIAGYRIDNLCSVHAAMTALRTCSQEKEDEISMAVFWDNEEIGSSTSQGAQSPFLPNLLERITLALNLTRENYFQILNQSLCLSIDLGHALHPNYIEKHEPLHQPLLNEGIILKYNGQQRYATDARSGARIEQICKELKLPLQKFVTRNDMPCGSTIGPITAALTGISTVDIGIPQLSMHSCRELMGCKDHLQMCQFLTHFLQDGQDIDRIQDSRDKKNNKI